MSKGRLCIKAFSRCLGCGGSGEVPDYHKGSDTCYDCHGYGYLFRGHPISRQHESSMTCPAGDLSELVVPADELHREALWSNLRRIFRELDEAFQQYRTAELKRTYRRQQLDRVAHTYGLTADEVSEVLDTIL